MSISRARVVTLNAALGPLDYRVPEGMQAEPGTIVVAPLGPRQLLGVAWEADRLKTEEVGDNRLRPLAGVLDVPPISAPLRRLCEWTADYYLSPLASVLRMVLPSSAALDGPRQLIEYRPTGAIPDRLTPQREQALAGIEGRQGTIRELADHAGVSDSVMRGLVNAGALEAVAVDADRALACPDPDHAPPDLNDDQRGAAASLAGSIGKGFDPVLRFQPRCWKISVASMASGESRKMSASGTLCSSMRVSRSARSSWERSTAKAGMSSGPPASCAALSSTASSARRASPPGVGRSRSP